MLLGSARFDLAGEEFLRLCQGELAQAGRPSTPHAVAALFGVGPEELWEQLDDRGGSVLRALVDRWNAHADERGVARVVLVDHGHEVELFLGHRRREPLPAE